MAIFTIGPFTLIGSSNVSGRDPDIIDNLKPELELSDIYIPKTSPHSCLILSPCLSLSFHCVSCDGCKAPIDEQVALPLKLGMNLLRKSSWLFLGFPEMTLQTQLPYSHGKHSSQRPVCSAGPEECDSLIPG